MAQIKVDKEVRRKILDVRNMILESEKADSNEAETRRRIERIFETLMGYDAFKHLSRERAVRGAGETEHVDFSIQLEDGENPKPEIMIEIKRVCIDLALKHLKQVSSYAINAGCEWILLTNSRDWKLYHVAFGQPPETKLIYAWNILHDDIPLLAARFDLISFKNVKKGSLADLWQKTNVLRAGNLLQAILSEDSIKVLRRELRKNSDVLISPEDLVSGIRRLLNETALSEFENIRICLPNKVKRKKRTSKIGKQENIDSETYEEDDSLISTENSENLE